MTKAYRLHSLLLILLIPALTILRAQQTIQDSLELHPLDLDIERARLNAARTDLWHRLIPHVSSSVSVMWGWKTSAGFAGLRMGRFSTWDRYIS